MHDVRDKTAYNASGCCVNLMSWGAVALFEPRLCIQLFGHSEPTKTYLLLPLLLLAYSIHVDDE